MKSNFLAIILKSIHRPVLLACCLLPAVTLAEDTLRTYFKASGTVHTLFEDHMVLQRDTPVPVWGWTEPGKEVTVEFAGQKKAATTGKDGRWLVKLDPMPASAGPRTLRIGSRSINDVLVGDVWVCSGQSNMQGNLDSSNNAKTIAAANVPTIRFLSAIPGNTDNGAEAPLEDFGQTRGKWTVCSSATADKLSRTAYFFGRDLHDHLKVPIGLIVVALNGSPIESWTAREALMTLPSYEVGGEFYAADDPFGEIIPHWHLPCTRFNSLIHPLAPFGVRGFLWYQGETNAAWRHPGNRYAKLLALMIQSWRACWGGAEIPFITIQLPNTPKSKEMRDPLRRSGWAEVQHGQMQSLALPKTGVAICMDLGDGDLHPKTKDKIGARAALAARMVAYGEKAVGMGPTYRSMELKGGGIRVSFDNTGGGLVSNDGEPLRFFALAGEDRHFVWADARLDGNEVVVTSPKVGKPVAVRYGWIQTGMVNLCNEEGLPASPFRTDAWDESDEKTPRLKGPEGRGIVWDRTIKAGSHNVLNALIVEGRTDAVRALLANGADPNLPELSGLYPIHRAALHGRLEIMQMLLKAGAKTHTETRNPGRATPLFFAAQADQSDVAKLLLDNGSDIEAGRQFYRAGSGSEMQTPLHASLENAKTGATARLLIERGARFDPLLPNGEYAIHIASRKNLAPVVELLLQNGVDPNLRNKKQETPLAVATKSGAKDVMKLLLDKGEETP